MTASNLINYDREFSIFSQNKSKDGEKFITSGVKISLKIWIYELVNLDDLCVLLRDSRNCRNSVSGYFSLAYRRNLMLPKYSFFRIHH